MNKLFFSYLLRRIKPFPLLAISTIYPVYSSLLWDFYADIEELITSFENSYNQDEDDQDEEDEDADVQYEEDIRDEQDDQDDQDDQEDGDD